MPENLDHEEKKRVCEACGTSKPLADFAGSAKKCRACEVEWAEFRAGIVQRLDEVRPPRAGINETDWREPVYAWARNHMPNETMLVRKVAVDQVNNRERDATRRGNDFLRRWILVQVPLFWSDIGYLPIRLGEQHIRLDASTPADMRQFAREIRAHAKQRFDSELLVADAAEELAERATQAGLLLISKLGDLPLDEGQSEAA